MVLGKVTKEVAALICLFFLGFSTSLYLGVERERCLRLKVPEEECFVSGSLDMLYYSVYSGPISLEKFQKCHIFSGGLRLAALPGHGGGYLGAKTPGYGYLGTCF